MVGNELESILSGKRLSEAERRIVALKSEDQNLGILESVSSFDWEKNRGNYYYLMSHLNVKGGTGVKLKFMPKLEFSFLPMDEVRKVYDVHKLSGSLSLGADKEFHLDGKNVYFRNDSPHANLEFIAGDKKRQFSRILSSYYASENTGLYVSDFRNKIMLIRIRKNEAILYRETFNGGELQAQRLWLMEKGSKTQLSTKDNAKLVTYLSELMAWHELRLYEEDCSIVSKKAKKISRQSGYEGYA